MTKYIFILLTCTAMALSSSAQDQCINGDTTVTTSENAEEVPINDVEREEKPIEESAEENENQLITACLRVSGLTLITSLVLLFIIIKKRSKMDVENNNPVNVHSEKDAELQFIKVQIQQIQTLLLKQSELLNQFAAQINNLHTVLDNSVKQQDSAAEIIEKIEQSTQQTSTQKSPVPSQQFQQPEETFVATASIVDEKVVLRVVGNQYIDQAPFEIKVIGEEGIYNFNSAATKSLLNYVDTKVTPYCNSSIDSVNIPTRIDTISSGTIMRRDNDWIVVQKAHIRIS